MNADWPLPTRASFTLLLSLLVSCACLPPASEQNPAAAIALTDDNFFGLVTAEHVHRADANARVAMAECAGIGALSVEGAGDSAEQALQDAAVQLQRALGRTGANAYAVESQRWERTAGVMRLVLGVQGLICSA